MDTSLLSLLLSLWLKSLINWVVVTVQRHYMTRSFSGFFCISLALIDSFLSFLITAIYYLEDFNISGWRFTRHHVCLLLQVACFIYGALHWPAFLLMVLDNFWTLSPNVARTSSAQKLTYTAGVCLLWTLATLYVFWVPHVVLLSGDDKHHCRLFQSPQSMQVLCVLLLSVTCVILFSFSHGKLRVQVSQHSAQGTQQSCLVCLRQIMFAFLSTWAPFLILMIIYPFLRTEMNGHLQMNTVWLCFLNSFSVTMALCSHSAAFSSKASDTITDGFCSWSFCYIHETEEWNYKQQKDKSHIQVRTLIPDQNQIRSHEEK